MTEATSSAEAVERSPAQFFFECGYGAAWGDAYMENGQKPAFTMSDETIERAWATAPEAYPDQAEWDRNMALAATPAASKGEPVAYVSRDQLAQHEDPYPTDKYRAEAGRYLPLRKTPGGNFTMPLYAHPAPSNQEKLVAELERLRAEINTPLTGDFVRGANIEATHQRERWGADHDAGKSPFDWFWLIGYLAQKAADAQVRGDTDKALHHTISTAAALANWHLAISGRDTSMRPGIDTPDDLTRARQTGEPS